MVLFENEEGKLIYIVNGHKKDDYDIKKLKHGKKYTLTPADSRSCFNYTDRYKAVKMYDSRTDRTLIYGLCPHSEVRVIPVEAKGRTNKRPVVKIVKSNKHKH